MIVWWFERVVSTYQFAAVECVVLLGPGVVSSYAPAEFVTTLDSIEQVELHAESVIPSREFFILAAKVRVLLLFGHVEVKVGVGPMGWNYGSSESDAYL
jgi:hypothetical protein